MAEMPLDSGEREKEGNARERRDAILKALGLVAEDFLRFDLSEAPIESTLAHLGAATGVSRVYIFQNHTSPEGHLLCSQRYEWTAPGITSEKDNPDLQNVPFSDAIARWVDLMSAGNDVSGLIQDFPDRERKILEAQNIKSFLAIPIVVQEHWWGFIGFDECSSIRIWTDAERETLRVAAHLFSAALQCQQMERIRIQHTLSVELSSTSDIDFALNRVLEVIGQISEIDCSGIYLADPQTGAMDLAAHRGLSSAFLENNRHYAADAMNIRLTMQGRPIYGLYKEVAREFPGVAQESLRAIAIIPIAHNGQIIAALNLASCHCDAFSPETQAFAEAIGAQIGGTLARLGVEAALRTSEHNLQTLFDSIDDFLFIVNRDGRILRVNPAVIKRLGYDESEYRKLTIPDLHPPEKRQEAKAIIADMLAGERETCPIPLITKDGTLIPVETKVAHGMWDNQQVLFGISRDISERRRLEEQLHHAQKMEAVGHLAGGVAHDFNNLLQVVLGHTDLLLDELESTANLYHDLEEVHKAAEKAAALTRQLLAFSRRQVLNPVDINLEEIVSDLLSMLRRLVGEHIELSMVSAENLGIIHADPSQIEQVVMNLCINARDAMQTGGRLTIEIKNVSLSRHFCEENPWAVPGYYTLLTVKDTGLGMDEATRAHIFEPFFTTKEVGHGTGLGLATVYGIVKQHNGLIYVESESNKGTSFHIYLPIVEREIIQTTSKPEKEVLGGKETILVAEDEKMVLDLVTRILKGAGYTVLTAQDGEEALRLYDEFSSKIDLLLLDVMMPKLGGRDVMDCIRAWHADAKFLFSSGYSESAIHTDFVIHDGFNLIQKPYRRVDLLRAVREVLDK